MGDNWIPLKDIKKSPERIKGLSPMTEQERIELELKKSPAKRMRLFREGELAEKQKSEKEFETSFQSTNRVRRKVAEKTAEIELLKKVGINLPHILSVQRKYETQLNQMRKDFKAGSFEDDEE